MEKIFFACALAAGMIAGTATMTADAAPQPDAQRQSWTVVVDKDGVMRRSDNGAEVSYYGTNYTLPFAHAYRAMPLVGADRKKTIDLDIMHLKRLGFNGFRLHLWDAELADSAGNLLANDHLDLLDYMISRLEDEGIDIVLTAQTNFGNGYPERNIDTGAFTYDFDKCHIHDDPAAQKIQERYLRQLAEHRNPYTGLTYAADHAIIAFEINNEPCHSAPAKEVTKYINRMERALRKGGFDRLVLYNVSHNPDVTAAYYDANIQGTTYQWYPDGLVAGHMRTGNLLPYVDNYPIPWSKSIPRFDRMARLVYEFDPGDVLCSYLYPAVTRTFRKEGFQWVTQFAYDPTPIAAFNTEYQTHFLNLLYTPAKALSMMVAGEAMRRVPRGADFGTFPADTEFGGDYGQFRVSYDRDLSLYNGTDRFIHSNATDAAPANPASLRHIAGCGTSPIVSYPGTGAYFFDRLDTADGAAPVWRLEVMPDVAIFRDPFEKTSLRKPLASLYYATHPMLITLPDLGDSFQAVMIADGENGQISGQTTPLPTVTAENGMISVRPGVYLLAAQQADLDRALQSADLAKTAAYCAPKSATLTANGQHPIPSVEHTPAAFISDDAPLAIVARVIATASPRSVKIYPSNVSFWREHNDLYEMTSADGVNYTALIPADALRHGISYNIVVEDADGVCHTYPSRTEGTPLDWDVITTEYYTSKVAYPAAPFVLYAPKADDRDLDVAMIPEEYSYRWRIEENAPYKANTFEIDAAPDHDGILALREYVGYRAASPALHLHDKDNVVVLSGKPLPSGSRVGLTGRDGLTYTANVGTPAAEEDGLYRYEVKVTDLTLSPTPIIPAPYPTFLPREFTPAADTTAHLNLDAIDFVQLTVPTTNGENISISLSGIILE